MVEMLFLRFCQSAIRLFSCVQFFVESAEHYRLERRRARTNGVAEMPFIAERTLQN